jgi:tRNA-binding protein
MSEVLVLGVYGKKGVVLIKPDQEVELGSRLG